MRVSQKRLARELGLTDRRVRQLEAEHILEPESDWESGYDLAKCRERYGLYQRPDDRLAWNEFFDQFMRDGRSADAAAKKALAGGSTDDVRRAIRLNEELFSDWRFIDAVRAPREAREFMHIVIDQMCKQQLGALMARGLELFCAEKGCDFDATVAALEKECASS